MMFFLRYFSNQREHAIKPRKARISPLARFITTYNLSPLLYTHRIVADGIGNYRNAKVGELDLFEQVFIHRDSVLIL